jgi:hypothetical protein
MLKFPDMITLGFLFPLISILVLRPNLKWQALRLFASSLVVYSFLQILIQVTNPHIFAQYIIFLVIAFCEGSNLEHIINNNSNQKIIFLKFLLDPVFLKGSGLTKRFLIRLICLFLLVTVIAYFQFNIDYKTLIFVNVLSLCLTFFIPQTSLLPDWLLENWIIHNLKIIFKLKDISKKNHLRTDVKFDFEKLKVAREKYSLLRPKDLEGKKWLKDSQKLNVMVLVLEGVGEIHFQKGWLPKLHERRNKNIHLESFICHQRNTNRGLYSLFSGVHPNLKELMAKPDLVAQYGPMDVGIAEVLKSSGYQTSFVQGAPSVFMCKDRFMPALGFDEIIGEEKFPKEWPRIKWGVDDQQLYRMAKMKISELESKNTPWFLGTLTVSAHHPFQASNKNLKNIEDAMRYADDELDSFLNDLDSQGILKNTILFITSDEVAGDGSHILSENLGTMIVLHPEGINKKVQIPFGQSDLALSICDAIDLDTDHFLGRSFFRHYENDKSIYFASLFQHKVFKYDQDKLSVLNYSGKFESFKIQNLKLSSEVIPQKDELDLDLVQFIEANDRGLQHLTNPVILDIPVLAPNGEEVVKSPGFIKVGIKKQKTIRLEFYAKNPTSSGPLVVNWLIQDMKHKRSFKLNLVVLPQTEGKFEKDFISPDDSWYDLSIKVIAKDNENWILENIQIFPVG